MAMKFPRVIASAVAAVVLEKIIAFFVWPLRKNDVGDDVVGEENMDC